MLKEDFLVKEAGIGNIFENVFNLGKLYKKYHAYISNPIKFSKPISEMITKNDILRGIFRNNLYPLFDNLLGDETLRLIKNDVKSRLGDQYSIFRNSILNVIGEKNSGKLIGRIRNAQNRFNEILRNVKNMGEENQRLIGELNNKSQIIKELKNRKFKSMAPYILGGAGLGAIGGAMISNTTRPTTSVYQRPTYNY